MKKTVLITLFTLAIIGCRKEKPVEDTTKEPQLEEAPKSLCKNPLIDSLHNLKNDTERQDWLKKHGAELCALDLSSCIDSLHSIKTVEKFEEYAKNHQENSTAIRYYDKTWKQIKDAIKDDSCYDSYISFDMASPTLELKKVSFFTTEASCYSIPFLKNLEKKYNLTEKDIIHFTKAIINVKIENGEKKIEKVIFKISKDNMESGYYDLSDFPGMIDCTIPNGI